MVVKASVAPALIPTDPENLERSLRALDGLDEVRRRLGSRQAWLVGGAVRDLLLGAGRADLDLVVEGDASEAAALIGAEPLSHDRFGTAVATLDGSRVDIAAARTETYPEPGALPVVEPASLGDDLARRDFTVNAMALPLSGEKGLTDPHGGKADLEAGLLRVLHPRSFEDDPTRALRAARYGARLGLEPEPETRELLAQTNLGTVSADRVTAELRRLVSEDMGPEALALLSEWGLAGIDEGARGRLSEMRALMGDPAWSGLVVPSDAFFEAARQSEDSQRAVSALTAKAPKLPSEGVGLVEDFSPLGVAMARICGAEWLDRWVREWRDVTLEIDGDDLIEAGVPQGPAIGRGLDAALAAKLDGEISTREEELRVALAAAAAT